MVTHFIVGNVKSRPTKRAPDGASAPQFRRDLQSLVPLYEVGPQIRPAGNAHRWAANRAFM
jgi:hypothetical protein